MEFWTLISLLWLVDASSSEMGLLGMQSETEDPALVKSAVFYSITSTQKGLKVSPKDLLCEILMLGINVTLY